MISLFVSLISEPALPQLELTLRASTQYKSQVSAIQRQLEEEDKKDVTPVSPFFRRPFVIASGSRCVVLSSGRCSSRASPRKSRTRCLFQSFSFTPSSLHQILKEEEKKKVVTKRKAYFFPPLSTTESPAIASANCPLLRIPIFSFSPRLRWLLPGHPRSVPSARAAPSTTVLRATSTRDPTRRSAAWRAPSASAKRGRPRKPSPCWEPRGTKPSDPVHSADSADSAD